MSSGRSSHQTKSSEEKKIYWDNTIRSRKPEPTFFEPLTSVNTDIDSTAISLRGQRIETVNTPTVALKESLIPKFIRERIIEVIIGSIIIPLFLWMAYQVYSLNREVGELRSEIGNVRTIEKKVDKLDDRIDKLFDQQHITNSTLNH